MKIQDKETFDKANVFGLQKIGFAYSTPPAPQS